MKTELERWHELYGEGQSLKDSQAQWTQEIKWIEHEVGLLDEIHEKFPNCISINPQDWPVLSTENDSLLPVYRYYCINSFKTQKMLSKNAGELMNMWIHERLQKISLSRIFRKMHFQEFAFILNQNVFEARSCTEGFVERILNYSKKYQEYTPRKIMEIGTGSGVIIISLLLKWTLAEGCGIDINPDACSNTYGNALIHQVHERFTMKHISFYDEIIPYQSLDCLVSNPPYVTKDVCARLDRIVKDFDPMSALDGGDDGCDFYEPIVQKGLEGLNKGGIIAFEHGHKQAEKIFHLLQNYGYTHIVQEKDLLCRNRYTMAMLK